MYRQDNRPDPALPVSIGLPALTGLASRLRASLSYRSTKYAFLSFEAGKQQYHRAFSPPAPRLLFIFGAQRSGTTHLERLFRGDPRSVIFSEFSALSVSPDKTAWPDLPEVAHRLQQARGGYCVVRSLLASHRATRILDSFPEARAVWMVRRAEEVVASMIRKWDDRFEEISRRVETDANGDWDLAALWQELNLRLPMFTADMADKRQVLRDLYGLYWVYRNQSYFNTGCDRTPAIRVMDYTSLLADPGGCMDRLRGDIGLRPPRLAFPIRTGRLNPRPATGDYFSPQVQDMCDRLLARLRAEETGDPS